MIKNLFAVAGCMLALSFGGLAFGCDDCGGTTVEVGKCQKGAAVCVPAGTKLVVKIEENCSGNPWCYVEDCCPGLIFLGETCEGFEFLVPAEAACGDYELTFEAQRFILKRHKKSTVVAVSVKPMVHSVVYHH